jgi:hypothetical protein
VRADGCFDGSKRAQRGTTCPDTGSDCAAARCCITTAGRSTGAISDGTGAHRYGTGAFGFSTSDHRHSAGIQRHCTGVDRHCTRAYRHGASVDRHCTGVDRHRTCAYRHRAGARRHGNGARWQGDGTRRNSARCNNGHRARDEEKKAARKDDATAGDRKIYRHRHGTCTLSQLRAEGVPAVYSVREIANKRALTVMTKAIGSGPWYGPHSFFLSDFCF